LNRNKKGTERTAYGRNTFGSRRNSPKVFVIENVDRFLKSDEFRNLLSEVKEGGLLADYRLVDPPGHEPTDSEEQKHKRYLLNAATMVQYKHVGEPLSIGVRRDVDNGRVMTYPVTRRVRRPKSSAGVSTQPLDGVDVESSYWRAVDSVFNESSLLPSEVPNSRTQGSHSEVDAVLPESSQRAIYISDAIRSHFRGPATKPFPRRTKRSRHPVYVYHLSRRSFRFPPLGMAL